MLVDISNTGVTDGTPFNFQWQMGETLGTFLGFVGMLATLMIIQCNPLLGNASTPLLQAILKSLW
jgi:hypothetical protein